MYEAARAACISVRQAHRNLQKQLAQKIKEDRKTFFAYNRSKSRSNVKVDALQNNKLISKAKDKSEELNDFFCSVFTKESISDIPVVSPDYTGPHFVSLVDTDIMQQQMAIFYLDCHEA